MRKGAAAIFGAVAVGCRKGNGLPMVNMEPQQLPPLSWPQKARGDFCSALLNMQDSSLPHWHQWAQIWGARFFPQYAELSTSYALTLGHSSRNLTCAANPRKLRSHSKSSTTVCMQRGWTGH